MNSFLEPFKQSFIVKLLLFLAMLLYSFATNAQVDKNTALFKTLKSNDSIIFERTFNLCEIEKLEPIIADDFEFYHDIVGIQNRKEFFEAVKNNICSNPGNFKRQLVKESLVVFTLNKNGELYGAIQKGKHSFKQRENKNEILKTVGIADFTHLWILENNTWKLKRVLSYNHLPYAE